MSKQITLKNDHYKKCPECDGKLVFQKRWEELFDRYDVNTPSTDLVLRRIHKEDEPKYICSLCALNVLVK